VRNMIVNAHVCLIFLGVMLPSCQAEDNIPPDDFVSLFTGRDLSGWKGIVANPAKRAQMSPEVLAAAQREADEEMRVHWRIEGDALTHDGAQEEGNICTGKDYENFELYVDWKILPGGDSGIYLRGSPQVQIWDPQFEPLWRHGSDKGSGGLWNNQKHERFPLVKADRPIGQWNTFYIKIVGENVTVKLNGQLVVDNEEMENYWERDKPIYPSGSIELQGHHNKLFWLKNIYVRELP